ncbi:hypothetical protein [Fictibacillus gelatini]|uniref:hypothetical protein n=1 Tax=Fictibacillus gelatini TaxID=225985 RepID=UPI0003F88EC2|nr:hypothetical protein [Fictibacillus gelatini]
MKKITVHEDLKPLNQTFTGSFDEMFSFYEKEIAKEKMLIVNIKKQIERFFEKEEEVSKIFKLQNGK